MYTMVCKELLPYFLKGMLGGPTVLFASRSEAMTISDAITVGDTLSLYVCVI
jgi:hypothetical protein